MHMNIPIKVPEFQQSFANLNITELDCTQSSDTLQKAFMKNYDLRQYVYICIQWVPKAEIGTKYWLWRMKMLTLH